MIKFGYFNAIKVGEDWDRVYEADDFNFHLRKLISNGVFKEPAGQLQVVASSGMKVIVKSGEARVDWHWLLSTTDIELNVPAADVSLPRYDVIYIKCDDNARTITIEYEAGTPSSNPTINYPVDDEYTKYRTLGAVYVARQAQVITQSNITDTRPNTDVCGWITGLVDQVDTSELFLQFQTAYEEDRKANQDAFDAWFNSVKNTVKPFGIMQEYTSTYSPIEAYWSGIVPVPSEYVESIDILNVYINGFKLLDSEYIYSAVNQSIILNEESRPFKTDSIIECQVFKNIDVSGDFPTLTARMETAEQNIKNIIKGDYVSAGDNITITKEDSGIVIAAAGGETPDDIPKIANKSIAFGGLLTNITLENNRYMFVTFTGQPSLERSTIQLRVPAQAKEDGADLLEYAAEIILPGSTASGAVATYTLTAYMNDVGSIEMAPTSLTEWGATWQQDTITDISGSITLAIVIVNRMCYVTPRRIVTGE